ncbi:oligopeptide/dipeptide ABC transporter ATPase [Enterobacter cloacae]|uniref:Oligopeptide/dipeptide ABC transporter ATPase n=1 Tax=Enterobacter cloacae TaxID=550 RepID=A0A377LZB2_ENTCL|nr:oligopeptide/dipeptide ABC transporter ATPase [Enterobacter cloacae]
MVGESGCGKSTFARAIIGLVKATGGKVAWLGKDLLGMKPEEWRDVRSDIQMIFQDPLASLNPRMTSVKSLPSRCGPIIRRCHVRKYAIVLRR